MDSIPTMDATAPSKENCFLASHLYDGNSPQHPAEAGPFPYYLEWIWSPPPSPSDRKPNVETNITQHRMNLHIPKRPVLRLRKNRPGSCSLDGGWGL